MSIQSSAASSNAVATTAAVGAAVAAAAVLAPKISGAFADLTSADAPLAAAKFLNRATFGSNDASVWALASSTAEAWLATQQHAAPTPGGAPKFWDTSGDFHLAWVTRRQADFEADYQAALTAAGTDAAARAKVSRRSVDRNQFQESWWARAITGDDQLRHRMALALSEIFVVSFLGSSITPRIGASWYDMLSKRAFGTYADLLKAVTLHPAMGLYLNIIGNQQADADPTRHPDENYAREVMQLMSIGQVQLEPDGTVKTDTAGQPIPTYGHDDIAGLAKVFTGWGWFAAAPTANTFARQPAVGTAAASPDVQNLISYPTYHSRLSKTFLGTTIAAYTGAAPTTQAGANAMRDYQIASLDRAIATLANHPNVGPFIGRRLIQRFVTSNPSPGYVRRVTNIFNGNPANPATRGDLFATLWAVLMDPEAMNPPATATRGKLREPLLRMTHLLRAGEATSKATPSSAVGNFPQFADLADPSYLNQAPLQAPSVFNFWDPDFSPGGSATAKAELVAPEFQAADALTVASYANLMNSVVQNRGWSGADVVMTYAKEIAAMVPAAVGGAERNEALIHRIDLLFFGGGMSTTLSARIKRVLDSIVITAKTTEANATTLRLNKVRCALMLTLTSPEYLAQA